MQPVKWIQTYSGHRVWPFNPTAPENVFCIEDIAHSLANICRFNGHVRKFYSVAEHSVLGSQIILPKFALQFLMHDAAEAYIGDVSRPIKDCLYIGTDDDVGDLYTSFKRYEIRLQERILASLDVAAPGFGAMNAIKQIDDAMLVREAGELFATGQRPEWAMHPDKGWPVAEVSLKCWAPEIAERMFLERFAELTGRTSAAVA